MSGIKDYELFNIVSDALLTITAIASISLAIQSLCSISRRKDPARRCFAWFKAAFSIFTVYLLVRLLAVVYLTVLCRVWESNRENFYYGGYDVDNNFIEGHKITSVIGLMPAQEFVFVFIAAFFDTISHILICITLLHLYWGIRMSSKSASPESGRYLMLSVYVVAGLLAILQLANVVIGSLLPWDESGALAGTIGYDFSGQVHFYDYARIQLLCAVVLCLIDVGILVVSIVVRKKTKKSSHVQRITKLFIVCASMLLLKSAAVIWQVVSIMTGPILHFDGFSFTMGGLIEIIFSVWPTFIVLTIVFSEGLRKRSGLRSSHPPLVTEDIEVSNLSSPSRDYAPSHSDTQSQNQDQDQDQPQEQQQDVEQARTVPATSPTQPTPTTAATPAAPAPSTRQTQDAFPWAIHPEEAPPEYSLPERPLPMSPHVPTASQAQLGRIMTTDGLPTSPGAGGQSSPQSGTPRPSQSESTTALVTDGGFYDPFHPPTHDEVMGLYHQADGRAPDSELFPESSKKH